MRDRAVGEWAPLPEDLGREARALAECCRLLKERTGLSLAALADRTHYSKSSWQRCLNGRQLPPRSALRSLADAAQADPGRLLGLREAVLRAGHRPPEGVPEAHPDTGAPPGPGPGAPPGAGAAPGPVPGAPPGLGAAGAQDRGRRDDGDQLPAPAAPFGAAVRHWRLLSAVLLAALLTATTLYLVGFDQEVAGCATVPAADR